MKNNSKKLIMAFTLGAISYCAMSKIIDVITSMITPDYLESDPEDDIDDDDEFFETLDEELDEVPGKGVAE